MTDRIEDIQDIQDNTFAAACYDQNTIAELEDALTGEADATDCATWSITADQWRAQIELALAARRADATSADATNAE